MDGVKAIEGELNAVVKEYLQMLEYSKSVDTFEEEAHKKDKEIDAKPLPKSQDENNSQGKFLQAFDYGNNSIFTKLWTEHVPKELQDESASKRLEFNIQLYFATFPIKQGHSDQKVDKAMKMFKTFLETRGAALSQTTEFVSFYALPFVPASSLKNHPSFSVLFQDSWTEELRQKLEDFLSNIFHAAPLPYLYKLYTGSGDRSVTEDKEKKQYESHIQSLQQQKSEHEYRASLYFKRYTKIQADYRNLINIAAELVDSLENAVRGTMVTPEYLKSICERLFSNSQNPMQSADLTRPGTAASLLRASVAKTTTGVAIGSDVPYLPSLNYTKIKDDLRRDTPNKTDLLLEALRLRLTGSRVGEQRDAVVSGYVANDILGCGPDRRHEATMASLLTSSHKSIRSQTALLFNAVASFTAGRAYIGQSETMVEQLIECLMQESYDSRAGENLLGALQKLSLRRPVQSIMIESKMVFWLIRALEEPEQLAPYSLEYSVALLMNLCLRSEGKKQCLPFCEKNLKLLADLLCYENREIIPYVNGTLYSILALPTIRQQAVSMGLEQILTLYMEDDEYEDPDMKRQIKFIIKQINTVDPAATDDPHSDNEEEEDDDDEEGDVLDAELYQGLIVKTGDLSGEELLSAKYLAVLSSMSLPSKADAKAGNSLATTYDKPMTLPASPRTPRLTAIDEVSSPETSRPGLSSRNGRPKTQSGSSSRNSQRRTPAPELQLEMPHSRGRPTSKQKKTDPFQPKPKIPRTPESVGSNRSRPSNDDVPLPTRSVSPPVPKPSSRGQDPVRCFQDCLKPCRNMKKRHFHCKICDYISERLDNMKRHIPYHFLKIKKERQRAPDGVKMVCHEYFTEKCDIDQCSYRKKNYPHFHCKLCKSWACNHKKSYKYRLQHLNRIHCMFFTEKDDKNEIPKNQTVPKKTKTFNQPQPPKFFTYPPAEEEVLNARRRAKCKARKLTVGKTRRKNADGRTLAENMKNAGNDIKNILQPIDLIDADANNEANLKYFSPKDATLVNENSPEKGGAEVNWECSLDNDKEAKDAVDVVTSDQSMFSLTFDGNLNAILQIAGNNNDLVIDDQTFANIVNNSKSLFQQLFIFSESKMDTQEECDKINTIKNQEDMDEILCQTLNEKGFSGTTMNGAVNERGNFSFYFDDKGILSVAEQGHITNAYVFDSGKIVELLSSKMFDAANNFCPEADSDIAGSESLNLRAEALQQVEELNKIWT